MERPPATMLARLVAAAALLGLASVVVAALFYFRAEKNVQRLTGWTVPANASLIDEKVESTPFGTNREYTFEIPVTQQTNTAWCELLRLAPAAPDNRPGDTSRLGGEAVCERIHFAATHREGFSIAASRRRITVSYWLN